MEYLFYGRNGRKDFTVSSADLPTVFDEATQYSEPLPDVETEMAARVCEVYACHYKIL